MNGFHSRIYEKKRATVPMDQALMQGFPPNMRKLESACDSRVQVNGQELLMFASDNYLGLATHPKVTAAAVKAIDKYGVGAGSTRLLAGTFTLHEELEQKIAEFVGTEAALAFSSGYAANTAATSTLLSNQVDQIAVIDERIHPSLMDGLRLTQIPFRVFHHNDMEDLKQQLSAARSQRRLTLIVDGVYSMDGDAANLPEIVRLAREHEALVMVNDAHGTGVMGSHGRGTPEFFGLHGQVDIVTGSLAKSLGGIGGFVAGSRELIDFLKGAARHFVFSTALPPAVCGALLAAFQVLEEEPSLLLRLRENANLMRKGLTQMGYDVGSSISAVIPVIVGDELAASQLARALHAQGIYASPVGYPAVNKGRARVRLSVMATHSLEDVMAALKTFENAKNIVPVLKFSTSPATRSDAVPVTASPVAA